MKARVPALLLAACVGASSALAVVCLIVACSGPISAPKAVDCRLEFAAHAADAGCVCSRAVLHVDAGAD